MDKTYWVAIISLIGILAANAVLAWSKWLDVKQKENDHKMSLRAVYLANKIKAAENAVSKWNLMLNYYNALEQYLRGMNPEKPLSEELSAPIDAQLIRLSDAMSASFSEGTAFLLYFDINDNFWTNDTSDLLFAKFSRVSALMNEIKQITEYLKEHLEVSEEDRGGIIEEQDFRLKEIVDILSELPAIVKVAKDRLLAFVRSINQQLKEYEKIS